MPQVIDFGLSAIRCKGPGFGSASLAASVAALRVEFHMVLSRHRALKGHLSDELSCAMLRLVPSHVRPLWERPKAHGHGLVLSAVLAPTLRSRSQLLSRFSTRRARAQGLRTYDLEDPTTALHQKYHDGTLQYTMEHMEWVEKRGFSQDAFTEAEKSELQRAARQRLGRWPRLLEEDVERLDFGPQGFGVGAAHGDPEHHVFVVTLARRPEKRQRVKRQLEEKRLRHDGARSSTDFPYFPYFHDFR